MKRILLMFLLLFPSVSSGQEATFVEIEAMLEGVDMEGLNTRPVIMCRHYGVSKEDGVSDRYDNPPKWRIAPEHVRDRMQAAATRFNQLHPTHIWQVRCQPNYLQFAQPLVEMLGGEAAAETALWYPAVTVMIEGQPVVVNDYDERRRYATCQPYKPDGFNRRSFIKAGCRD